MKLNQGIMIVYAWEQFIIIWDQICKNGLAAAFYWT